MADILFVDVILLWIACAEGDGKLLIMIDRTCGWEATVRLLRERIAHKCAVDPQYCLTPRHVASYPPLRGESGSAEARQNVLQDFNRPSNGDGSDIAIMVADSKEAGEGVSFNAVRRLYLANVPDSWLEYQQVVGRAVRAFSHFHLHKDDSVVSVKAYVGKHRMACQALPVYVLHSPSKQGLNKRFSLP